MAVSTDSGTGVDGVEPSAAAGTPQNRAVQLRAGQRAEAAGASVAVRIDSSAPTSHQRCDTRNAEAADLAVGQLGELRNRLPGGPVPVGVHVREQ